MCTVHPTVTATVACPHCRRPFCGACTKEFGDGLACRACSQSLPPQEFRGTIRRAQLALLFSILGFVSCGLLSIFSIQLAGRALFELEGAASAWAERARKQAKAARLIAIAELVLLAVFVLQAYLLNAINRHA